MTAPPYVAELAERIPARYPESGRLPRKQTEEAIRLLVQYGYASTAHEALAKVKAWFSGNPGSTLNDFIACIVSIRSKPRASDTSLNAWMQR